MSWARPASLSGWMLLGLLMVAVPLVVAVVNASLQMRSLAADSQQLVVDSVQNTRLTQDLFSAVAALDRSTRLYQIVAESRLLASYRQNDERLTAILERLARAGASEELRTAVAGMRNAQRDIRASFPIDAAVATSAAPSGPSLDALANNGARLDVLRSLAERVARASNQQIDEALNALASESARARELLLWQAALLVPLTLLALLAVTFFIGRPIRQIDRAISDIGRGSVGTPIAVSGPGDLRRLGRQLEWMRQRLLEVAEERSRFLRHMSHELKTPLANIREGTELLMDGAVGELDSNQREVTAILRDNGLRLQRLIENLLSFSAWQSQSLSLELSEFRIRPLIKQVIENQHLTLLSQRVRLEVVAADLTLYADRGKLRLILDNLLSNAIKYSPRGGTIHIRARSEGHDFVLDVADSGKGIPKEDRSRIFEAFFTSSAPKGGHLKGTGIGLSVVMEFVNVQGGKIEIVDGEFQGAHFRIRMPMRVRGATVREQAHAA